METITTKFDNFGKLSISENRRYLMEGDKPFFWLGDTAWLMLLKLDEDEIYTYLRNRKGKGYNVIQTVLIQSPQDVESSLASGRKDVTKSEYWNFVDQILDMAEQMGLYIGLLPAWGSLVKSSKYIKYGNNAYLCEFLRKTLSESQKLDLDLGRRCAR